MIILFQQSNLQLKATVHLLDRNQNGRGLLLYVLEDIPCKIFNEYPTEKPLKNFLVGINLNWGNGSYHDQTIQIQTDDHLHCIDREIDFYSSNNDNFAILGDLWTQRFLIHFGTILCIIQIKKPH